ncbi:MAG: dihydrofolate reductase [Oscillospiraceae bacterium]|jgi:dihydrofolate reductase
MNAIVAVNEQWGIGADDALLVSLPPDLKYFRAITMGKTMIVGRKTLKTFPGGAPLKGRENLVLSREKSLRIPGAVIYGSMEEVMEAVKGKDPDSIFVIGGESVYRTFLPRCRKVYVTQFTGGREADRFFPNLDEDPSWMQTEAGPWQEFEGVPFRYTLYEKKEA